MLLHDNTKPHGASDTQNLFWQFGWEQFDQSLGSLQSRTGTLWLPLFLHLKLVEMASQYFQNYNNVTHFVQQWLTLMVASFCEDGIDKPVDRYDKCLNRHVNNVKISFVLSWENTIFSIKNYLGLGRYFIFYKKYHLLSGHTFHMDCVLTPTKGTFELLWISMPQ